MKINKKNINTDGFNYNNDEINQKMKNINGWFYELDSKLFDIFLTHLYQVKKDLCEIGIYEGKSLVKILEYSGNNNAIGIDCNLKQKQNIILNNITKVLPEFDKSKLTLIDIDTNNINTNNYKSFFPSTYKFIHLDGAHQCIGLYNELMFCQHILDENGIIAIDDIFDMPFAGKTDAMFKFLYDQNEIVLLLLSCRKAYLCHKSKFKEFSKLVENSKNDLRTINTDTNILKILNTINESYYCIVLYNVPGEINSNSYTII